MNLHNVCRAGMPVVVAVLAASPPAVAAATIDVNVRREDATIVIQASASLKATTAIAWQVLTDYDRYADFIPGVHSSHVIARHGDSVQVEQYDEALFSPLHAPVRVIYQVIETPPDRLQSRAKASALPELDSSYMLTPVKAGARLDYAGRVVAGSVLLARISQWSIERKVTRQFQALADRIERSDARFRRGDSDR